MKASFVEQSEIQPLVIPNFVVKAKRIIDEKNDKKLTTSSSKIENAENFEDDKNDFEMKERQNVEDDEV